MILRATVAAFAGLACLHLGAFARAQDAAADPGGGAWTSKGELAIESRAFRDDDDARTEDRGLGMFGRLELRYTRARFETKARGFGRLDHFDRERDVLVAEEAWAQVRWSAVRLRAGVDMINWTATEAFHPADVINARNLDSDLENFEKVGEPMAEVQVRPFEGSTVDAFFMPFFTSPLFTSPASRLSFAPPGWDLRGARRLLDRYGRVTTDDFGPQGALQIRQVLGAADLTVHGVYQMDRGQPVVLLDPATAQPFMLFQTVAQVGGTAQGALGAFVLKLEWAARRFTAPADDEVFLAAAVPNRNHATVAGGLEYNLPHGNGSESTFILEGQALFAFHDLTADQRRLLSPFPRAALGGWRFAANDAAGREAFLGVIWDVERRDEFMVNASFSQRLGETWTVKAGVRVFQAPTPSGPVATGLAALRNADHVRLTLTRYF